MTKDEALKLALEALHGFIPYLPLNDEAQCGRYDKAITAIKEALAQPEQKPVAWLITDEKINSLQVGSIQRLIDRARHAHMTDIKLRINGQDEWYEADWLKHLTRTTPPQRKPLSDEEIILIVAECAASHQHTDIHFARAIEAAHGIKELV